MLAVSANDRRHRDLDPFLDRAKLEWQLARLARTSKAVARLRERPGGALVELVEVPNPSGFYRDRPLEVVGLSELGRRHYQEHLAAYRRLYPAVRAPELARAAR